MRGDVTYGSTNKEYGSTPHLQDIKLGKFGVVYENGKAYIGDYTHNSYVKNGATPTTFYLPQWKPLGFVTLYTDGSGSISSYIYSYDMYE